MKFFEILQLIAFLSEECSPGKIFSNCSNSCNTKCQTLSCSKKCTEPETCVKGCVCAPGTVENSQGECVSSDKCKCELGQIRYTTGEIIEDLENCKKW